MTDLAARRCVPCRGDTPPLPEERRRELLRSLHPDWRIRDSHHLQRTWRLRDFAQALALANRIGEIAERENHHPTLEIAWGRLTASIHTHAIDDLTESDFILAAKIDRLG